MVIDVFAGTVERIMMKLHDVEMNSKTDIAELDERFVEQL